MTAPRRIQMRRTKGWRKPEGVIYCGRPSKWGNPFRVGERIPANSPLAVHIDVPGGWGGLAAITLLTRQQAVAAYFDYILQCPSLWLAVRDELAGHDLGCWCGLDQPCHVDVLLELANAEGPT